MRSTLLKLLTVLAVFALIAAACGDDDDDTTQAADDSAADDSAADDSADDDSADDDSADDDSADDPECVLGRGVTDTEIKFGTSTPLTGNLAALGEDASIALNLTVDRINNAGGVNGRMITLNIQDDEYNPEKRTANVQFFADREGVFGMWGDIGSAPLAAAIDIAHEAELLILFPWALDLNFFDVERYPLFYSITPSAYAQTLAWGNFLLETFPGEDLRVGLMTINSADGEQTVQGFRDSPAGDLSVSEQTWERDSTTYGPQILAFQDAEVTDIYVGTGDTQFAQFLQEADQIGLEARIWGSSGTVTANAIELAGGLAEGQYGVNVIESSDADVPGMVRFREEMLAAGAEETSLGTASLLAYTGGLVLEEGLNRAGPCLNLDTFREAMESITDFDTGGIMPPLTFSSESHLGNNGVVIFQVQDGEWVRIN